MFKKPIPQLLLVCFLIFTINYGFAQVNDHIKAGNEFYENGNKTDAATHYNKAAFLLRTNNRKTEAIKYYEKVLEINTEVGNKRGVVLTRDNLAMLYIETENYIKAIEYLKINLEIYKKENNTAQVISMISNLADSYKELGQFDLAITTVESAIEMAREYGNLALLKRTYGIGYDIYKEMGNEEKTHEYFGYYAAIDKKIKENQMDQVKVVADSQVNVAVTQKKLTQIELAKTDSSLQKEKQLTLQQQLSLEKQKSELQEQEFQLTLERQQKKFYATGFTIVAVFAAVLVVLIIWLVRLINRLKKAKTEISAQNLKLAVQNKEITASIRYANTIQTAILPAMREIRENFEAFVIYMPKDIVSGDFYWYSKQKTKFGESHFISVIDCTGHGVPGAFMSMIASQILNEIVTEKQIHSPALILEELNTSIHEALRQSETDNNDGMDLALCRIENSENNYTIAYSGAKRPLYFKRGNENMNYIKGDRKSIGGYKAARQKNVFTEKNLKLTSGDIIYMFSDGMTDQNNAERKKYGRQQLENILESCSDCPIEEQEQKILNDFTGFMNFEDQRDDITLFGLKFK